MTAGNVSRLYGGREGVSTRHSGPRGIGLVTVLAVALCACGSAGSTFLGHQVTLTWQNKGHTVKVARGTRIVVKLKSLYWHQFRSSNRGVVRLAGKVTRKEGDCPPGVGCGTVKAPFKAVGSGSAHLRANRTSCGEALPCTKSQGRYDVTIRVSG
jgi:hypothetical protein